MMVVFLVLVVVSGAVEIVGEEVVEDEGPEGPEGPDELEGPEEPEGETEMVEAAEIPSSEYSQSLPEPVMLVPVTEVSSLTLPFSFLALV